ncbi:MAG: hypothetical protein CVU87_10670 [Firmicutes bacterium HGW-Firmicutes-12]|nr:MAG: hypothetical protein CVU87_10670 [Firmicutes bacterium HGW-Firmicutes-12]
MKIENWVETRKLEPRWGLFRSGILNVVLMLAVFLILWRVFMDPRGLVRLYTPMRGYAYVQWLLIAVLMTQLVFRYWPFQESSFLAEKHPAVKGSIFMLLSFAFVILMINVVFQIVGALSFPYFSEAKLLSLGQNPFNALEYSHQAITMLGGLTALMVPIWVLHINNWPAQRIPKANGYFTSAALILFAAGFIFTCTYHLHFGVLFYPFQYLAAAFPWWEPFANTLSSNFVLGMMMSWTAALWIIQVTYEGFPFKNIPKQPWRAIAGVVGTFVFALILYSGFHFLQEVAWGAPVRGSALLSAVDWRYLHSGELSLFMLMIALIWGFYFKNWPKKYSMEVNFLVRTVIVCIGQSVYIRSAGGIFSPFAIPVSVYNSHCSPSLGTQLVL